MFETKDDKLSKMEKKLSDMERKMNGNFERINDTISTLNEIILHLQADNTKLRGERDFLMERHKKMLKRVPVPDLSREVNDRLVKPAAGMVKENFNVVRNVASEGFVELKDPEEKPVRRNPARDLKNHVMKGQQTSNGKTIDRLYELVSELGRLRADDAARRLNVHEIQVEEWGKILEDHDLIKIKKGPMGRVELVKI